MSPASKTFSESWYRIAEQAIALRPSVRTQRQFYRGEKWYVLHDPYNNQFYRLRPAAYEFVVRLRMDRNVEDVWQECLTLFADDAPGQEEVLRILTTLYQANLLQYSNQADNEALFKRFKRQGEQETRSRLLGFMFPRFTLLDPDNFVKRTLPVVGRLISRGGAILWGVVVLLGLKSFIDHADVAFDQAQGILAPSNLGWLYLSLIFVKVLHEFGHAYFCRKAGGEVHRMGVMFLIFTPLPFVDATSSWTLRSRFERLRVAGAGILVEIFIAALAAIAWAYTGSGLFHSLCYNVMFIASISTVLFNANPLLRFDGYYMLSDYLDIPNLHARSRMELTYVVERYLFGRKEARSIAGSRKESRRLVVFSILSGLYRLVVFSSIILFVADQLMVIGMVLALLFAIAWVVVPIWRFARYIAAAPQLSRCRARAIGVTCAMLLLCVGILRLVPLPSAFAAPGVLQARPCRRIYVRVPGRLQELEVQPGTQVLPGMLLAQLDSTELELELKMTREQLNEAEARKRKAMHSSKADLQSMEILVEAIRQRCDRLRDDLEKLTVVSQDSGRWVGPDLMELSGRWLDVGTELGWIVGEDGFEFVAVVSQAEASRLFNEQIRRAEIRLRGQAEHTLRVVSLHVVPMEQQALPSYSLGWRTGGDVETDLTDPSGLTAREPFFKVIATVPMSDHAAVLRHGLAGRIRFKLPPEPLLTRLGRRLFQMLQKRYRL